MIISAPVIIKELFEQEKNYKWHRPEKCLRCKSNRLWGHGFVAAFFDGFNGVFWLKRYRCPDCKCVIKLKPEGFFKRFQASIKTIRSSIESKVNNQGWLSGLSRTRQYHWYRALKHQAFAYFGQLRQKVDLNDFDILLHTKKIIPVSRSFNSQSNP